MKRTIYKYPIQVLDEQTIEMPAGATVLSVQVQAGPCIWALVDADAKPERRTFRLYGTGHPCESTPDKFIGTFQMRGGSLVFHLFEA